MNKTHQYLISLLRSALKGETLIESDESTDAKMLAQLAQMHHIVPIIYPTLTDGTIREKLNRAYMASLAKSATQDIETERILSAYEEAGIDHIPLKGYVIKSLYPSPEMRESTDFDVYVPFKFNQKACNVMASLGYSYDADTVGIGMHDNYHLGSMMEAEVHKSLMAPDFPKWCRLCEKIVKNATLCDGYKHRYEFSKEDYYLYMQLHTIKHLKYSSCGIKSIVDIWVYLTHYKDELDFEYINSMLDKGGIGEIDKNLRALSDWWFNEIEPENPIIYQLGNYIINSGAFGTLEQYLGGRKTDETKFSRLCRAFFLPMDEMKMKYPILKKFPLCLPFAWIYRAIYVLLFARGHLQNVTNLGENVNVETATKLSEFKRKIGL